MPSPRIGTDEIDILHFPFSTENERVYAKGGADFVGTGSGADTIYAGTGNDTVEAGGGNDTIYGEAGADVIRGGSGNDTIYGGSGVDTAQYGDGLEYYALTMKNSVVDITHTRSINGVIDDGHDTLHDVDYLTFYDFYGSTRKVTYSVFDLFAAGVILNIIDGGSASDKLSGGIGRDVISGAGGNDTLMGKAAADKLNGGAGNDKLYGGEGKDVLLGGAGTDTFIFDTKPRANNVDTISDFNVKDDTIWLDDDAFTKIGKVGDLAKGAFQTGAVALDASDRILYDKATGKLFYDADGKGGVAAVQIALLGKGLALTASDFDIIG